MKVNLGSGNRPQVGYVNLDNREVCRPDVIADINDGLPFKNDSIDEIRAYDFLEHIPIGKTVGAVQEIWRVLKPGGLFDSKTPSTDGRGAFQDPTHVSFWNANSWIYYMDDAHRDLYGIRAKFKGKVYDRKTDSKCKIIHTFGELYAVK